MIYNLKFEVKVYGNIYSWLVKIGGNTLIFDHFDSKKDVWVKKSSDFSVEGPLDIEMGCQGINGAYIDMDVIVNEKKKLKKDMKCIVKEGRGDLEFDVEINDDNLEDVKENKK